MEVVANLKILLVLIDTIAAGVELRFGYHIPEDFGSDVIHAGAGISAPVINGSNFRRSLFGAHIFASTQIEAVYHDNFFDGNTWQDNQKVKKPLMADLSVGVSLSMDMFKLTYQHLFRTKQFEAQKQGHTIGSPTLTFHSKKSSISRVKILKSTLIGNMESIAKKDLTTEYDLDKVQLVDLSCINKRSYMTKWLNKTFFSGFSHRKKSRYNKFVLIYQFLDSNVSETGRAAHKLNYTCSKEGGK